MAQTKRKRRTKHRGNAAGIVEARGRTGRRPTEAERKASGREAAAERRRERMMRAPSWKSATMRAGFAAIVFGVLLLLAFDQTVGQAVSMTVFVFFFYIPLGYYTDALLYKRRVRRAERERT
jgi:ABC-type transport system involved in cytochrome bd biosynthesis fused ATPase/permease subunit